MERILNFKLFELKSEIQFKKQPKKEGAKTDIYFVYKSGTLIGQIKWYSRLRGYSFLPSNDCSDEIKDFVKTLMYNRRKEK